MKMFLSNNQWLIAVENGLASSQIKPFYIALNHFRLKCRYDIGDYTNFAYMYFVQSFLACAELRIEAELFILTL